MASPIENICQLFFSFRYHIECYKYHNYGHIAHDYRSMMDSSMKGNTDIIYESLEKKTKTKRKQKQKEQVNEEIPEVMLMIYRVARSQ